MAIDSVPVVPHIQAMPLICMIGNWCARRLSVLSFFDGCSPSGLLCAAPVILRWRVSNPPDVSLIWRVAFRSYVFTHDVVSGNGSVRRGAERWEGPSTEGLLLLLRVGLAISLVTSHLLRSGVLPYRRLVAKRVKE